MVSLNTIKSENQPKKNKKRIGRGTGSGQGCTAGKGMNGARARSGFKNKLYFEGGQLPLIRRLPKRGFNNIFKVNYQIVNVGDIEKTEAKATEIDAAWLHENGLIHSATDPVKVLGNGELTKSITIKANKFSKTALDKIEKASGKAEVI